MHPVLEKIEKITDALVLPALLAVLVIVILELFFTETAHHYDTWINFADFVIILIFTVDLSFKFHRASTWEGFLKGHWLEILAITPLFYMFRFLEVFRVPGVAEVGQETAHLAEGARSGRFSTFFRSSEMARSTRFGRFIRFLSRSPRFAKAAEFFKHPDEQTVSLN